MEEFVCYLDKIEGLQSHHIFRNSIVSLTLEFENSTASRNVNGVPILVRNSSMSTFQNYISTLNLSTNKYLPHLYYEQSKQACYQTI